MTATVQAPSPRRRRSSARGSGNQTAAGWLFIAPVVVIIGVFLVVPIVMAVWVSVSDWSGRGNPFGGDAQFIGTQNYAAILTDPGLQRQDFGTAIRNNLYYVIFVVPLQTIVSLALAVLVNRKILAARGFFRTAFYFPSVTSTVAITSLFLFLFTASGAVNRVLGLVGIDGPNWTNDSRGVLHLLLGALGVDQAPAALQGSPLLGVSWWNWLAGPSLAMTVFIIMAIFTTSGTFMLLFIAALQNISGEVEEAALMDGANGWERFRFVTLPMLRPTLFTVITLGLIGTWQIFDQIYTAGQAGGPGKSTLTPAYLSYQTSFEGNRWGQGAAIAFVLFAIIVAMTAIQRAVLRERETVPRRRRFVLSDGTLAADVKKGR